MLDTGFTIQNGGMAVQSSSTTANTLTVINQNPAFTGTLLQGSTFRDVSPSFNMLYLKAGGSPLFQVLL